MVDIPLNYIGFLQPTFCNGVKIGYVYVGARGIASACQKVEVSVSRERVARVIASIHRYSKYKDAILERLEHLESAESAVICPLPCSPANIFDY
jgi:metal-dependent hydrolase (beta-lactamase superfamily II)